MFEKDDFEDKLDKPDNTDNTDNTNESHDVYKSTNNINSSVSDKINNEEKLTKDKIKNNDGYEEFITNENYALYISEAVDTKNTHKQKVKVKKNTEATVNVIGEKKKSKSNKNIFVTLEQTDIHNEKINNDDTLKKNEKVEQVVVNNKLVKENNNGAVVEVNNGLESSVFKKTEIIDKTKISHVMSNIKSTTKLEQIQTFAIELGLSIVAGSTKDGKPKNKTKNEIIDEIKKLESSM